jgi:AcrR family transcriptional regulator
VQRTATRPSRAPLRGAADDTRARLIAAAATQFNQAGYHGTNSNRIAREAGYAPATFYKHFADKREIFFAAWESWVAREWSEVATAIGETRDPDLLAARIVELTLALHVRWRGLRTSMHVLAASDPIARRFHRAQRRRQLELLAEMRGGARVASRSAEEDAILLFTLERTCDAIALGEARDLGLSRELLVETLCARVRAQLR